MHKTHNNNNEHPVDNHHIHPDSANVQNRRSSLRQQPHSRSPSPALFDAATNVVEFIKDERYHRGRRSYTAHSRYPKDTSSASTSPDLDRSPKEKNRSGHPLNECSSKPNLRRPPRRWRRGIATRSSSPCYPYDPYRSTVNQSNVESYEHDNNVLSGRSRTPSPGFSHRFGNRNNSRTNTSTPKQNVGRKLPATPKQPSTLQIPFKSKTNFPKLDVSPSTMLDVQPTIQSHADPSLVYDSHKYVQYDDIERELYEHERDVDSEFDFNNSQSSTTVQGPLSFEEALLLSRPIRSTSVVWNGFKTSVVGYSPEDSKLDEDEWC